MLLAGDVGGTKTLLGLFEPDLGRPVPVEVRSFATLDYPGLPAIVAEFLRGRPPDARVRAAAFGVAGPVIDQVSKMTNVPWRVDAGELARGLGIDAVRLLNDLEATAWGVPALRRDELKVLQEGRPQPDGNVGIIAAGTGLGASVLHRVGNDYVPMATELGHSDFAARTDRELAFVRFARARFGRVEIESLLSGPGLVNLWTFTHQGAECIEVTGEPEETDLPAAISASALEERCPQCVEALDMFVEAYGAVAGNLALTAVTTRGVFIGGGIAPRILPALTRSTLIQAFTDKGPMRGLLEAMPVAVILNEETALLGAAVYAARLLERAK